MTECYEGILDIYLHILTGFNAGYLTGFIWRNYKAFCTPEKLMQVWQFKVVIEVS